MMAVFRKLARKSDVPLGSGRTVDIEGRAVALLNDGGRFHVVDNTCLHMGGPLGEGAVEEGCVVCPWHQWRYDLKTGAHVNDPGSKVKVYEVRVEGEEILVGI